MPRPKIGGNKTIKVKFQCPQCLRVHSELRFDPAVRSTRQDLDKLGWDGKVKEFVVWKKCCDMLEWYVNNRAVRIMSTDELKKKFWGRK